MVRALLIASGVAFVSAAGRLGAQAVDSGPTITAAARGEIHLPPDIAIVRLVVASRASTAAAAATETARRVRAVTDSLHRWGLAPELTAPLALEVHTNEAIAEGRLVDYEAKAVLTVRVRQFDHLGAIVDGALAAGATTVPGVRFDSDSADAARLHALAKAFQQARAKADAVARAAGATLGRLIELSTSQDLDFDRDDFLFDDFGLSEARSPKRDVPVSATVSAKWRLLTPLR